LIIFIKYASLNIKVYHYFYDNMIKKDLEDILKQKNVQLASEEFFGVNRFVEFLPDLADVQWRAIYKNSNWYNDAWCPEGEHLASGSLGYGQLWGAEITVNGKRLSPQEVISFYRNLNKRRNSTFKADAKKICEPLHKVFNEEAISDSESFELHRFGMIDGEGELTYAGACCLEVGVPQEKQLRSLHRKDHLAKLKEAILAVDHNKYKPKETPYFTHFVEKKLKKLLTPNLKSLVQGNFDDTEQLDEIDQQFRQELQVSLCDLLGIGMIRPHFAYGFLRPFDRKLKPFVGSLTNIKKQTIDHLIKKLGKEEVASGVYSFLSEYFVSQPLSSQGAVFSQLREFMDETDILEEEKVRGIDLLIADGNGMDSKQGHAGVRGSIEVFKRLSPKRMLLTHINHHTSRAIIMEAIRGHGNIDVAYDGLQIEVET